MKVEYRSKSSRRPLPDENSVESIRASRSRKKFRIFCFQCGGTIWRTGTLGQFASVPRRPGAVETSCFEVAANPRRFYGSLDDLGDSRLFYPSGGHKPMLPLAILMVSTNAAPGIFADCGRRACTRGPLPPRRLQPNRSGQYWFHDRTAQTILRPGGILLENQDVGRDVQRRMGKPV